ncbi:MAG: D-alanyl-D-alanine carboxypeptidase/D-alanyl-D-alanine-endopeptidase [Candidatus Accumulibacter sp.]|jgi:D-alanyl-D-alanine carboxypeptidase/D-alanyl-D-alanine-endopeptidase (penicillin-binding protein 4)|nr:D-alanyl-D-alanine carboxypeptidase/D-alanyl-D-alanine-endopeptidase [Accumulibacter sp.]
MTKTRCLAPFRRIPAGLLRFAVLCCGFVAMNALAAGLPAPVDRALEKAGISAQNVSVLVQGAHEAQPLVSHNARAPMNPASVMKLLTAYAALEILGPAHTWKTEALSDRLPVDGRLQGNLYLRGSGDPRLALEQFWLFLRKLRMRGVSRIEGDLVLDRGAFSVSPHDPGQFDNEPLRPYNAGPDALLVNLKSLGFILHPDKSRARVDIWPATPGTGGLVRNRLTLGSGACAGWRERLKIGLDGDVITLSGAYPASCGDNMLYLSPWAADFQVERLFRALWQELGGTLHGRVREGRTPAGAHTLVVHESPALAEIVREINKFSNNVMARQVFLSLDAARPATPEGARRAVRAWLSGKGLGMPELALDNGSGLSREERISADSLARLLLAAWRSPVMPELLSSLPLAGVDGTLRKRLTEDAVSGRAHLKTGYLENVRALAGYVLDQSGERWVVVFLINDPRSHLGKPAMDALLQWITTGAGKKS